MKMVEKVVALEELKKLPRTPGWDQKVLHQIVDIMIGDTKPIDDDMSKVELFLNHQIHLMNLIQHATAHAMILSSYLNH